MKIPNIEEIIDNNNFKSIDIVNSTLDISKNSLLLIDNKSQNRLDLLVNEALRKKVKKIITSDICSIEKDEIIKVANYEEIFSLVLSKILPTYMDKNYFGITGTNGKTTSGYYLSQMLNNNSLFIGTNENILFENITNEKHLTTPKIFIPSISEYNAIQ